MKRPVQVYVFFDDFLNQTTLFYNETDTTIKFDKRYPMPGNYTITARMINQNLESIATFTIDPSKNYSYIF